MAGPVALVALVFAQDRELRPAVLVVAPLLIVAIAVLIGVQERIERRTAEARARGTEPDVAAQKRDKWAYSAAAVVYLVSVIGSAVFWRAHLRDQDLRRAPILRSEVFHVLPGCPSSGAGLRVLPERCDDPRYRIDFAADTFGLPYPGRYWRWLRVGPDAVRISMFCNGQPCEVREVRTNVFATREVAP